MYASVVTVRTLPVSASSKKYGPSTLVELKPHQTVTYVSAKASQTPLPGFESSVSESSAILI